MSERPIHPVPAEIQIIGDFLAIRWNDGTEDILPAEKLRALSPSADNMGERDLLGRRIGGDGPRDFTGVGLVSWQPVGGYAIQLRFSDGHETGIYSYEYLRHIADAAKAG